MILPEVRYTKKMLFEILGVEQAWYAMRFELHTIPSVFAYDRSPSYLGRDLISIIERVGVPFTPKTKEEREAAGAKFASARASWTEESDRDRE